MIDDTKKKAKTQTLAESTPVTNDIQDIDLGFVEKKKFRIAGDYNRILEINVSDMNIYSRFTKAYPKLEELAKDASAQVEKISIEDDSAMSDIANLLENIDKKMREQIDYLFDTNASEVCAPSGNMFDPVDGSFRFEHIINTLAKLYTTGFDEEIKKFKNKSSKYTSKYQKKYHN